jgi:hypothetical protein
MHSLSAKRGILYLSPVRRIDKITKITNGYDDFPGLV